MAIIYVSSDSTKWGTGQGAPLTAPQHDNNVYEVVTRVVALEAIQLGKSVEDITSSGNIVTFHMSDDSRVDIAFELPDFRYRGTWVNATAYAVNDIITVSGSGIYRVKIAHTSAASGSFNPESTDESTSGDGSDAIYELWLPEPDLVRMMKWRGAFTASLAYAQYDVFSSSVYGLFVVNSAHTSAATFDPDALDSDGARLYTNLAPPRFSPVDTLAGTTHTCTRADAGKYLRCTNTSGCIIVFEDDDFDVGTEIYFEQASIGTVVFIGDTNVSVIPQRADYDHVTPYEGAVITAKFVASGTWKLIGPEGPILTA